MLWHGQILDVSPEQYPLNKIMLHLKYLHLHLHQVRWYNKLEIKKSFSKIPPHTHPRDTDKWPAISQARDLYESYVNTHAAPVQETAVQHDMNICAKE